MARPDQLPQRAIKYTPKQIQCSDAEWEKPVRWLLDFLTEEMQKLINDSTSLAVIEKHKSEYGQNFYKKVLADLDRPHLKWEIGGNKSYFYYMILKRIKDNLNSMKDRKEIARICDLFDWDTSQIKEIREELVANNLYISKGNLDNILRSKKVPAISPELKAFIDFTVGTNNIAFRDENNPLKWKLDIPHISGKSVIDIEVPQPVYSRANSTGRYAVPIIQLNKDKSDELLLRTSYDCAIVSSNKNGILGVDLNETIPFVARAICPDGSYSGRLEPSKETLKLHQLIKRQTEHYDAIWSKLNKLKAILGIIEDSDGEIIYHSPKGTKEELAKYVALKEQSYLVKNARTKAKEHRAWLVARDVVNLANELNCGSIHLEDLRFVVDYKSGTKWDYTQQQKRIREIAELSGIAVEIVHAGGSSSTDPFTDEIDRPVDSNKIMTLSDGSFLDKDDTASLELARRPRRNSKEGKKMINKRSCRAKHNGELLGAKSKTRMKGRVTPKRPKAKSNSCQRREEKKRIIEAMLCNAPGYPQPVSTGQGNLVPNGEFTYSEGLSFALPPPEV